jgi:glycosyltransferase involved in cell wall biosynthesis
MPEFSLIVATKDRTSDLARLIASLEDQPGADFELIVVDQNEDDRLVPILDSSHISPRIMHLRSAPGVSRARNLGIENAQSAILGFPDDDCWYPAGVLADVADWFRSNPTYDILSLNSLDAHGTRSGNRWFQSSCDLSLLNVYRTSVGYSFFVRSVGSCRQVRYDENIGPGADTPYLGGEDTDYILSAMRAGARGRFEAQWHIGHPLKDIRDESVNKDRVFIYGLGMGHVQRKHHLVWLWASLVAFDFIRALMAAGKGSGGSARLWYWHGHGLVKGFLTSHP